MWIILFIQENTMKTLHKFMDYIELNNNVFINVFFGIIWVLVTLVLYNHLHKV